MDLILIGTSESQLKEWAAKNGTSSRFLRFKNEGKDVLVLLVDIASGLTRENIYVYYQERNQWHLCLLRLTNCRVEVVNTGKALVFRNPKGGVLVEQPFNSMRYLAGDE